MVGACTLVWIKYGPTNERYDLNKYFGVEKESELGITVNNEVMEMKGLRIDNTVYIPYEIVRDYLNGRFYFDSNENILLYTLEDAIVRTDVGSKTYTIAKEEYTEDYAILKTEGHAAYIAIDFVKEYTDLDYVVYEQPGRVMIGTDFEERVVADVKRNTEVRLRGGVKSPILTEVSKGDTVRVIEEIGDWKKICTADGVVGYVKSSRLKKEEKITIDRDFQEQTFSNISVGKTINLAWHQVTSQTANNSVLEVIANTKGLTTISPTWFSVVDNAGNISSIASSTYVNYAHQSGIDVWALVDNFSDNIDQLELLSHTSARENLVNQLISEALKSGIDGINVDFEQIPTEAGEHYIQFIRELSVKCRLNNLVLSVDNYVPMGYNAHYHREEQGVVADYVIIMGYDEHYNGSFEAGSVASYDYVKSGIEETLKDVPAEKVVNAMPFYTRLWKEVPKTEEELESQEGSEAGLYEMKVTSEALGMTAARNRVNSAGAEIVWDDKVKQNYAEWQGADGATYKVWLEDASSLEAKLQLMKEYNLAGTAAWKLGFETSDIWDLILKYVN
ncbi:MAG: glycosyl hydrolase family 18 protein [bacterium]|nr:glycosyl hydrolase family 18 protein [bacterium]